MNTTDAVGTSRTLPRAMTLNYATTRRPLRWFSALSIASALFLWHFLVSCGMWGLFLVGLARNPDMRHLLPQTLIADASLLATLLLLLALSITSLITAIHRHRLARLLLLITLGASITSFAYDITRRRYQIHVFIATKDYWDAGGKRYDYFTWWWYNDRWFR